MCKEVGISRDKVSWDYCFSDKSHVFCIDFLLVRPQFRVFSSGNQPVFIRETSSILDLYEEMMLRKPC